MRERIAGGNKGEYIFSNHYYADATTRYGIVWWCCRNTRIIESN